MHVNQQVLAMCEKTGTVSFESKCTNAREGGREGISSPVFFVLLYLAVNINVCKVT